MWFVWDPEALLLNKGEALWPLVSGYSLQIGLFLAYYLSGSRGPCGYHDNARKLLHNLEQFHSELPKSESPALGREMENAPVDIGGFLAAIPPLSLWLSIQRCSGSVVGEGMPRYPDPTPLQPPLSPQEKVALGSGTRKVISAQKEDKACR